MAISGTVEGEIEQVFDRIADIDRYDTWIAPSLLYRGSTTAAPDAPVAQDSAFFDSTTIGRLTGRVTEFSRPTRIAFEQSLRRRGRTVFRSTPAYTLTEVAGRTVVAHTGRAHVFGSWKLLLPVVYLIAHWERRRVLAALKESFTR